MFERIRDVLTWYAEAGASALMVDQGQRARALLEDLEQGDNLLAMGQHLDTIVEGLAGGDVAVPGPVSDALEALAPILMEAEA